MNSIKLTSLTMCGFIAQLVEHRTGTAEVTGSNPVEALILFRLFLSNCLKRKIYCDDLSSLEFIVLPLESTGNPLWLKPASIKNVRKKFPCGAERLGTDMN